MTKTNETKRIPAIAAEIDLSNPNNGRLTLTGANGSKLTLHASDLTPSIATMAMFHGLKQKLVDAAAISRDPETGRSATVVDKFRAMEAVYNRLISGLWNEPREGGGNVGGLLLKALCRFYPNKSADTLREWLDGKTDAEKAALRKNPKIAAIIIEIQAEAAKTDGIDSDGLLNELE